MAEARAGEGEEFIDTLLARPPFHRWLRPRVVARDPANDSLTVAIDHRPELARSPDAADYHGGIIAALVDIAGHACLAAKLGRRIPTIDMRVDYLRAAANTGLRATGRVLRAGSTVGACDVEVRDDENRLIAVGRCTFSTRAPHQAPPK
jgi:uncharacterized protein (TIGR00369 family)